MVNCIPYIPLRVNSYHFQESNVGIPHTCNTIIPFKVREETFTVSSRAILASLRSILSDFFFSEWRPSRDAELNSITFNAQYQYKIIIGINLHTHVIRFDVNRNYLTRSPHLNQGYMYASR
jgi:hypothetical protein